MTQTAAIIGGGVIGGGWAARFLLAGWDVQVFDPDPQAKRKISEVMENARASLPGLLNVAPPTEGNLTFHATIAEAVSGAAWVQESVPERLDIKQATYTDIMAHVGDETVVGSSTSGYKPSELQQGATRANQIVVAHPFNPVYLLPLVELVTTGVNDAGTIERAKDIVKSIGMYPLHLKKEIDAHVADRFLEAVWREALWLIKDGIATTEEIDDAIRYGFGIRWAQMGLFETYRVAGGEAGMKHFMAQFGPALKWPWTKLMDVPDLTDELVNQIADQSDAQSGMHSIRELERIRDKNLVAMMRSLKLHDYGAGALLNARDAELAVAPKVEAGKPLRTTDRVVPTDWADYNGHMNDAKYMQAFSESTDAMLAVIGAGQDYVDAGHSYFTVENHLRYLDEIKTGTRIVIDTQVLSAKGKKLHIFQEMRRADDGALCATAEQMFLHVSLTSRGSCDPVGEVPAKVGALAAAHADMPMPDGAGRFVGERHAK